MPRRPVARASWASRGNSVEKYSTPLEEATTPSLEALKAYSLGRKTHYAKGDTAALPFYKRAVELDPNFAMAYAAMSVAYYNLNEVGRAAENARKAYELREKVTERERYYIEANYYLYTTGELEKAEQVYELWQQTYPRDMTVHELWYSFLLALETGKRHWRKPAWQCVWNRTIRPTMPISASPTRTSTDWMRRRGCTSRRKSARWRVRASFRTATNWLF